MYLKRFLFGILGIGLLFSLVAIIAWQIFRTDHPLVLKQIKNIAEERWNTHLSLASYDLSIAEDWSGIDLQIKDLSLAPKTDTLNPVILINSMRSTIDPWALRRGDWEAKPIVIDSAWVHLRKDAEGRNNLRFGATRESKKVKPWTFDFQRFPECTFNFIDFHHEDLAKSKWQRAQFSDGQLAPDDDEGTAGQLRLQSKVHFDGLVFNPKDGGYLMDRTGTWDLRFGIENNGYTLALHSASKLLVDHTEFQLEAYFHRADTNRLQLKIRNSAVITKEVFPMLSDKIQQKLGAIKIDQPVIAMFYLNEVLLPSVKGVIRIDFASTDAAVRFKQVAIDHTDFIGYYSNDCDGDGVGDAENSCVVFDHVHGDLFGVIPTKVKGRIDDLSNAQLSADGQMEINLPRLNDRLAASNKVTFREGDADLQIKYNGPFKEIVRDPFNEEFVKMNGAVSFQNVILDLPSGNEPFPSLSGHMHFDDHATELKQLDLNWRGAAVQLSGGINNLPEFLFFDTQALQSDLKLHFDHLDMADFTGDGASSSSRRQLDFEKIKTIARQIASNINGSLQLEVDRISYDTLYLTDVHTHFKLLSPLLYEENADSAMIQMEALSANFMGQTPFELGLGFSQEVNPHLLFDMSFPDAQVFANTFLPAGNRVKEGKVGFYLNGRLPLHSLNSPDQLLDSLLYRGRIDFNKVDASLESFNWPLRRVSGILNFDHRHLNFDQLNFGYEGAPFELNGVVEGYRYFGTKQSKFDLSLQGRSLNLRNNQWSDSTGDTKENNFVPAGLFQNLDTIFKLGRGQLRLDLDTLYAPKQTIMPAQALIVLKADPINEEYYQLELDSLRIGFGGRNLISGGALLTDPVQPKLQANIHSILDFKKLADFLPSKYIELQDGFFRMNLAYEVELFDDITAENYLLNADIEGAVDIVNGKLFYNYRDFQVDDFYGHILFDNRDITIRDLDLSLNGNRLFADGVSTDFFPFFIERNQRARIELNVASPEFDFGGFTAPHGLGKDTLQTDDATTGVLAKTGGFIDQLLSKGSLDMNTDFDLVKYEGFLANSLKGNISLHPDTVKLAGVKMGLAKGAFQIDGAITNIIDHKPKIEVDAQFVESNLRQLFQQFQNFGQADLDSTNVEGYASVDIQFSSEANSNYSLLPNTMFGDFQFKLFGGQLINLPAVRKMSGFLSKKRQLNHILIDTLETFTHIRGSDLYIDRFKLHSSSFDFNVEGIYSLGNQDNTKILFGVPLSNLFKRHISSDEMKKESKKRKGLKVFIEARPKKDKMRFRWKIPFSRKKYRLREGG